MPKRIIALMLALTIMLSFLPLLPQIATAEEPVVAVLTSHSADSHKCEHCDQTVTWDTWGDTDTEKKTLPKSSGHYYLVCDIKVNASTEVSDKADLVLCLNGYTIDGSGKNTIYRVGGSAKLTVSDCTAYTDDGGSYHAGTICNGKHAGGVGGGFYVYGDAQLTMHGGIIADNRNTTTNTNAADDGYSGGGMHIRGNAKVALNGVLFTGNTSAREGGAICIRSATSELVADSCTFLNNRAGVNNTASVGGAAIYIKASKVTLKNCNFKDNTAEKNGGAIAVVGTEAVLNLENCQFAENTAAGGSAVYCNSASVNMTGCTIEKNSTNAANAGTVYVYGAKVKMTDTMIRDNNTAKYGGSAIYMTYSGQLELSDCTVTGNHIPGTESKSRAAIYLTKAEDKLILKGKTVITGNFIATDSENPIERGVYLQSACAVDVGGLTDGAKVILSNGTGWDVTNASQIAAAATAPSLWNRTWVIHENSGQAVDYSPEKGFYFALNTDHIHCQCGETNCTQSGHTIVEYLPWTDTTTLPTHGNYYLTEDISMSAAVSVNKDLNICLNGHTVTAADGKRHFSTPNQAILQIAISDCTATTADGVYTAGGFYNGVDLGNGQGGGAIFIRAGGNLQIFDGIFANNTSITGGGAVRMAANTSLIIYDGVFMDNTAVSADGKNLRYGGAVSGTTNTNIQILGGKFNGNRASRGSAVYAGGDTLVLADCVITGNNGTTGAVYMTAQTATTLKGSVKITNNQGYNLYLSDANPITVESLAADSSIGVTGNPGVFSTACQDYSRQFTSDSQYLKVEYVTDALHLMAGGEHKHCLCAKESKECDHSNIAWVAWESTTTLPASGNYYLLNDVTLSQEVSISKDLNLCLNGHTVTAAPESRIISTPTNVKLTMVITDCTAITADGVYSAGMLTGGNDLANNIGGGAFYLRSGADLHLYGGKITGNKTITGGGAILVANGSSFTMHGGEISHNACIKLNGKYNNGGAIYASRGSNILILGGNVSNNAGQLGGAIYQYAAIVVIKGGSFTNNTAADRGGAIYATEGSDLTISGGNFQENKAQVNGGGIYAKLSKLQVNGGQIRNNSSKKDGAGIYFREGNMDISGNVLISGNQTETVGGGVCYSGNATGTISGGTFEKNQAISGGGLIIQGGANVEMTGGSICNHNIKSYGGAIYVYKAQLTLSGGTLTGNATTTGGGAIYANQEGTKLILNGASLQGNKSRSGGAVLVSNKAVMEMHSGLIANNTASNAGGGIYGLQSTVSLSGGSVTGNKTETSGGGGIYLNGATLRLSGASITGNVAKGNGGGIGSVRRLVKINGVETSYPSSIFITGGYIADNEATYGGGLMMSGIGGKLEVSGTTITNNTAKNDGAGMYISKGCTFTIANTKVFSNKAKTRAGGIYCFVSSGSITNSEIYNNTAGKPGGAMYIYRKSIVDFKNVSIHGNTAGTLGGGIYGDSDQYPSVTKFEDCTFYENTAVQRGGAFYGCPGNELTAIRCTFRDNTALGTEKVTGNGGALAVRDIACLEDCTFSGNKAQLGGAIYAGNMDKTFASNGWGHKGPNVGIDVYNCSFTDNDASRSGGAMFLAMSAFTELNGVNITGNTAGEKGSAIYAEDDLTMLDVTITKNVSGSNGYSVFLADSEYDGQTYFRGLFKFGNNIIITDNQGGNLYLDKMTVVAAMAQGYGPKTHMDVTLDSGTITNRVFGIYDYEGSNQVYTITYGNRSLTDPEIDKTLMENSNNTPNQNSITNAPDIWLYIAIGAVAVVTLGAIVLICKKKKKANTN